MTQYIDSNEKLQEISDILKTQDWIALDTEFIRERNYYPKLCLIQVAAGDILAYIDPLCISNLSPFFDILVDPKITKVLHAAYQDLEIFYQLMGTVPSPIFDTQPAASVLGIGDQMGYARLVESLLEVSLEKSQTRTDWSRRPLNEQQIDYAIDDVRYLQQIYPIMLQQLQDQQRLEWLENDFARIATESTYAIDINEAWKRVKGKQYLKGQQLAILQKVSAWREQMAMEKDKPRRWVLSDDVLLDLARHNITDSKQIKAIRGLKVTHVKHYFDDWLAIIEEARKLPKEEWPKLPIKQKLTINQEMLIDILMMLVKYQAKKYHISTIAISNRKSIIQMVTEGRDYFSEDWRGNLLNNLFKDVISGKKTVYVHQDKVMVVQVKQTQEIALKTESE